MSSAARGITHRIIHATADMTAREIDLPEQYRRALQEKLAWVFEFQIGAHIGTDELRLRGWKVAPSVRAARRRRIEAAIMAGEAPKDIAKREGLHPASVRKMRAACDGVDRD